MLKNIMSKLRNAGKIIVGHREEKRHVMALVQGFSGPVQHVLYIRKPDRKGIGTEISIL